jgi:hypothetical protein
MYAARITARYQYVLYAYLYVSACFCTYLYVSIKNYRKMQKNVENTEKCRKVKCAYVYVCLQYGMYLYVLCVFLPVSVCILIQMFIN